MTEADPDRIVPHAEVGKRLGGVDARTIQRSVRSGVLVPSFFTPGGHARFTEQKVAELCLANAKKSRGSQRATTASITPSGTTPPSDANAGRVWTPATTSTPRASSPSSSSDGRTAHGRV